MPRAADVYSLPAGSTVANGETSDATDINTPLADIAADLNVARPILAGGTGATTASAARTALGLAIGTDVQAYDAGLLSIAGLTTAADKMIYTTASDTYAVTALTAFGRSILDDADEATFKATVNLEIGTDVQAFHANLADVAAITQVNGGLIQSDGTDYAALAIGTYGQSLRPNAAGTALAWTSGDGFLYHLQEQQTSGTAGGGATTGSWQKRTLNTEVTAEITGASVTTSTITLPAGTYYAEGKTPGFRVNGFQCRLQNTSDATTLLTGTSARARDGADSDTQWSFLGGRFTLAAAKTVELQMSVTTTHATDGWGLAASQGTEVFSDLKIWKVA